MKINPDDKIGGYEILKIRKLLRRLQGSYFSYESVMEVFKINKKKSLELLNELEAKKLIQKASSEHNLQYWDLTLDGGRLALATAAKPIKRETADKKLNEFLVRVREVNKNPYYLYKVVKVILFGSYLSDKEKINDVDLAIKLLPKINDYDKFKEHADRRTIEAIENGRRFSNYIEELTWAETEVKLFLKSRSRSISLHSIGDGILDKTETKIIYDKE